MYYYIRYEKTAVIAKSETEDLSATTFLKAQEIYQLILIEGKEYMIKQFNSEEKETFKLKEVNGIFWINVMQCTEVTGMDSLPEYKVITMAEYKEMVKGIESKLKAEGKKRY